MGDHDEFATIDDLRMRARRCRELAGRFRDPQLASAFAAAAAEHERAADASAIAVRHWTDDEPS